MTVAEIPDVALVIVGENSHQALELIRTIVREAACPVIAILAVSGSRVHRPSRAPRHLLLHRPRERPEELQSSIDIALERFAEYHALEGAFGRRAITERAKGT